jgi:hypothetical protein
MGLGTGASDPALPVGILLANDNVTLDDVKIAVTDTSKAAPCSAWTKYKAAVSIGRAKVEGATVTLLTGADLASSKVTIQNCDITSTANDASFSAGVYVCGTSDTATKVIYPSTDITLSGNTITAKGYLSSAVQAVNIARWHPSVVIKDNTITASYGTKAAAKRYGGAPASAIFMDFVFGETLTGSNATPDISGNTLVSDVYSFFFNACETVADPAIAGATALRTDNFSVAATAWALPSATDKDSTYKKLFNALLGNIDDYGFAYVGNQVGVNSFEVEQYEIKNKAVYAISVYGDHISSSGAYNDTSNSGNAFSGSGNVNYDYGRKLASNTSGPYTEDGNKFCYGPAIGKTSDADFTAEGNYAYDTDLNP